MKFDVERGNELKDADGNIYVVLDERLSINQNSHSQRTNMDYLCKDIGRKKERWVQYLTMEKMFEEGKLNYYER